MCGGFVPSSPQEVNQVFTAAAKAKKATVDRVELEVSDGLAVVLCVGATTLVTLTVPKVVAPAEVKAVWMLFVRVVMPEVERAVVAVAVLKEATLAGTTTL